MRRAILLLTVLLGAPGTLRAQQGTEYRLDDTGEWSAPEEAAGPAMDAALETARRDLAEGRAQAAYAAADRWITANERSGSPHLAAAYLLRADAQTAAGNEYKALYDYERVIRQFPESPEFLTAVERERDIGVRYVNGLKRKFLGLRFADAADAGEELLIRVQERVPGSRLAESAGIELADYYYRIRDMTMADEAYDLFLTNYPASPYRMKAMQRRVYANLARFKGPRYNGAPLTDSSVLIRRFSGLYPGEAERAGLDETLLTRIDESAGLQLLEVAKWYERRGDAVAARLTLRRLLQKHPQTAAAREALDTLTRRGWLEPAPAPPPPARDADPVPAPGPGVPGAAPAEPRAEPQTPGEPAPTADDGAGRPGERP